MKRNVKWVSAVAVIVALGLGCDAAARAVEVQPCTVRLALTLTPDVPDPRDPGFLGSMLSSATSYQLTWISGSDTQATVELTGPGPSARCQDAVDKLSRDAHILDLKVLQPGEAT